MGLSGLLELLMDTNMTPSTCFSILGTWVLNNMPMVILPVSTMITLEVLLSSLAVVRGPSINTTTIRVHVPACTLVIKTTANLDFTKNWETSPTRFHLPGRDATAAFNSNLMKSSCLEWPQKWWVAALPIPRLDKPFHEKMSLKVAMKI